MNKGNLSESLQDYLETIYIVLQTKPVCRIKDIEQLMCVTKPSIVQAVNILKERDMINKKKYGYITLTGKGDEIASNLYNKHETLRNFIEMMFDVTDNQSDALACEIEHHLTDKMTARMKIINANLRKNPELINSLTGEI